MYRDFDMIVREIPDCGEWVTLYPVSCVHIGAIEHNETAWANFCALVKQNPSSLVGINGDMINNATRSSVSNIFEETMRPRDQKRRLAEYLAPIADQILYALPGNHEARSGKDADDDPMYDVMCKLDREDVYRENAAFVKLSLGVRSKGADVRSRQVYAICALHGAGGGIYTGAAVNRNERFAAVIDNLDVLVVGHAHKGVISRPSRIVLDLKNNFISERPCVVVGLTAWMQYGGYAMRKMMLPASGAVSDAPQTLMFGGDRTRRQVVTVW